MIEFWAVMLDETGCEFGVGVSAGSRTEAFDKLREDYPESRCVQLESPEDTARREREMYHRLQDEYDDFYDDYDEDEDEDEEDEG